MNRERKNRTFIHIGYIHLTFQLYFTWIQSIYKHTIYCQLLVIHIKIPTICLHNSVLKKFFRSHSLSDGQTYHTSGWSAEWKSQHDRFSIRQISSIKYDFALLCWLQSSTRKLCFVTEHLCCGFFPAKVPQPHPPTPPTTPQPCTSSLRKMHCLLCITIIGHFPDIKHKLSTHFRGILYVHLCFITRLSLIWWMSLKKKLEAHNIYSITTLFTLHKQISYISTFFPPWVLIVSNTNTIWLVMLPTLFLLHWYNTKCSFCYSVNSLYVQVQSYYTYLVQDYVNDISFPCN